MKMNQITWLELLEMFDKSVHEKIKNLVKKDSPTHLVVFENLQMDSSAFGSRSVLAIGPNNTYKTLEEVTGQHLNDLPSQRQYPTAYYEIPERDVP